MILFEAVESGNIEVLNHKEDVQKEHKETTRLIVSLALGSIGLVLATATLISIGFNITVSSRFDAISRRFDTIDSNLKYIHDDVKEIRIDVKSISGEQAKTNAELAELNGYIKGKHK